MPLNDSAKIIIFFVLCFGALADLVLACIFFNLSKQFLANAKLVKACITTLELSKNGRKATLSFKDSMGKDVVTELYGPSLVKYKENDEIEIFFSKHNSEKVKSNTFFALWGIPFGCGYGALMFVAVLGLMLYMGIAKFPFRVAGIDM